MERLTTDWKEFLSLLISHRVKFLLIGAHAVAVHARPRFTEDLDVFVEPTSENARRLREVLKAFGFGSVAPSEYELVLPNKVFMLGRVPNRIDILTGISGVTFASAWKSRVKVKLEVGNVSVIGYEQLLTNKRASGRPKDLIDVSYLTQFSSSVPAARKAAGARKAQKRSAKKSSKRKR